jgi:hypothetical protein
MDNISSLWAWATEAANQRGIHTIALIAGIVGLVITAIWGLFKYFSRDGSSKANLPKITATNRSIAAGKNVAIHFGITLDEHHKALKIREQEIRGELTKATANEFEVRAILEKELRAYP